LFVPVQLSRKSIGASYVLEIGDDDPMVNPALAEYLRRSFGIASPELPDLRAITDDYDLQELFQLFHEQIRKQPGWAIGTEAHVGQFSFHKLVMYKDLEANSTSLAAHEIVRQIVTRSGPGHFGLPDEVRKLQLDAEFTPDRSTQVVDADASQLRAIAAVARGYDLVIEGPPGTGKSQTITNLIAQALAAGKTVLFVAEKMAALQVVQGRLKAAGLGEFCLELHSTKANKRLVMRDIANALDASLQRAEGSTASPERLGELRAILTGHADAVHTPRGALGASPYRAYGELARVVAAPKRSLSVAIDGVTQQQLDETVRRLEDLAATAGQITNPAEHPWRDSTKAYHSEQSLDEVGRLGQGLITSLDDVIQRGEAVHTSLQLPAIRTFMDIGIAREIAGVLKRSPGAPLAVLESAAWNAPPPEARALLERGRRIVALKKHVHDHFKHEVLSRSHSKDIAYVSEKSKGILRFLAFLDGPHREITNRWRSYRLSASRKVALTDQMADMRKVEQLRAERAALEVENAVAREFFGALWKSESSSWDMLENYIHWVVEFRGLCVRHALASRVIATAAQGPADVSSVADLEGRAAAAITALVALRVAVGWPTAYLVSVAKLGRSIEFRCPFAMVSSHQAARW